VFATFRAEQNRSNPMVIYRQRPPEKEALAPAACLNPPAVVPHGLVVRDDILQINPGRQTAKASPVSGTKSLTGGMSEDHDRCFSILVLGAFSTGVFNTNAIPRINIVADVWVESSIMTGVC
jgi:hypothetical protein